VDGWLEQPCVAFIKQGDKHWDVLKSTLLDGQVRGPMTTDAQLAALAIETGAILYTTDRDFARFPGLRWLNPLT